VEAFVLSFGVILLAELGDKSQLVTVALSARYRPAVVLAGIAMAAALINVLAVVIGAEHSLPDLKPFSLVAASYLDGRGGGSLGVIGPTRMRYSRAISLVESAARAVTDALDRN